MFTLINGDAEDIQGRKPKKAKSPITNDVAPLAKKGKKQAIPIAVAPMLCSLTKEPLNDPEYLYEIKWDGYRIISNVQKGKVRVDSRSAIDYTKGYPAIVNALKALGHDAVIDGEVVVFKEEGLPNFDALQLYNGHDSDISYCVFDLLWLDGYNLMALPLEERKRFSKLWRKVDPFPVSVIL